MRKILPEDVPVMKVEVLAIGNEVLEGFTVNSNAAKISQILLKEGYAIGRHLTLPDDPDALFEAFKDLPGKERIVIATGGLGPTGDDRTQEFLDKLFALKGFTTITIPNPVGSAAGVCLKGNNCCIIALPGVPFEVLAMMPWIVEFLKTHFPPHHHLNHQWIYFMRMFESKVDPSIQKLLKQYPDLGYGIYPSQGLLGVHFFAPEGSTSIAPAVEALKKEFYENLIDCTTGKLEEAVFLKFTRMKLTLATAESCTGGVIAAKLVSIPNASNYFLGGVVTYADALKKTFLDVNSETLERDGAVSEEVVRQMARALKSKTGADYAIAVSGIAGPGGGTPEKPVGTVWYAIANSKEIKTWCRIIPGNRELIIERTANYLLSELLKEIPG